MTCGLFWLLERLGIMPGRTMQVSGFLNHCAAALAEAKRLGILTLMEFIRAHKPD